MIWLELFQLVRDFFVLFSYNLSDRRGGDSDDEIKFLLLSWLSNWIPGLSFLSEIFWKENPFPEGKMEKNY